MALQTVNRENVPEIAQLVDGILAEHKGHPSNYASIACRFCIAQACYHIQQKDKHAANCEQVIRNISPETIDAAIHDVNAALGENLVEQRGSANV